MLKDGQFGYKVYDSNHLQHGILPAGASVLHDFVLEYLGIPPISNYIDAYTLEESKAGKNGGYEIKHVMMDECKPFRPSIDGLWA